MPDGQDAAAEWKPIPDPTVLTTEALNREISLVREYIERSLTSMRTSFEAGRDAMHDLLDAKIDSSVALEDEKFRKVSREFELLERQREEQKGDTQKAVDAALTAQKEAVKEQTIASERAAGNQWSAMMKQMDQISATFNAAIDSIRRAIDDNKDRIVLLESRVVALEQQKIVVRESGAEHKQSLSVIIGGIGILLTIIIIAATLYLGTRPR